MNDSVLSRSARDEFYAAMDAHFADWRATHDSTEGATAAWEETDEFKQLYPLAFGDQVSTASRRS